jgi:hypothetical protein
MKRFSRQPLVASKLRTTFIRLLAACRGLRGLCLVTDIQTVEAIVDPWELFLYSTHISSE